MKTAVFTGSFNPFTVGHDDIVRRALTMFDRIVIGVGFNIDKGEDGNLAWIKAWPIQSLYEGDSRVEVTVYEGLTVDFARQHNACAIIRGVRTVKDFEYERDMALVNRNINEGIETAIIFSSPEYAHVSSSMVRELYYFNHDVSVYLPEGYEAGTLLKRLPRYEMSR